MYADVCHQRRGSTEGCWESHEQEIKLNENRRKNDIFYLETERESL